MFFLPFVLFIKVYKYVKVMKNFLLKLKIIFYFLIVFAIGYTIVNYLTNVFMMMVFGFFGVFFLLQALGLVDELNGYGKYNKQQDDEDDTDNEELNDDTYQNEDITTDTDFDEDSQSDDTFNIMNDTVEPFDNN